MDRSELTEIISTLVQKLGVRRFVNIGPCNQFCFQLEKSLGIANIRVLESIDLDPMLSWFWSSIGSSRDSVMIH